MSELQLPIYQSLRSDSTKWETERFLNPNELVIQTHRFMKQFQERATKKTMPTHIFFLDKGARKIGEMFEILFSTYCPGVTVPQINYINFGGQRSGPDGSVVIPFRGDPDIIQTTYEVQDNARILIVDDFAETSDTKRKATQSLKQAYPHAIVESTIVYDKIPNWQGDREYAGIDEYSARDYMNMALDILNNQLASKGIHFDSLGDFVLRHKTEDLSFGLWDRYSTLEKKVMGSIS